MLLVVGCWLILKCAPAYVIMTSQFSLIKKNFYFLGQTLSKLQQTIKYATPFYVDKTQVMMS